MNMVTIEKISKSFTKMELPALEQVSFEVKEGELFGLIGPDGAGKTSLFRILTTLLLADSGHATVNEFDVVKDFKEIRKQVGYMPGKFSLYQDLTVEENLHFFATVFGTSLEKNYELIRDIYIQIEPFRTRKAGKLSGGMKQKLALCCALIHKPKVLFLDEPTTGVDAVSRKEFWDMLGSLKNQGITILVSTPYMDEASLCEKIALIQNGQILSIDTPQEIVAQYPDKLFACKSTNMSQLLKTLRTHKAVKSANAFGEYHHVTLHSDFKNAVDMANHLEIEAVEVKLIEPTIEDCFINLM